MNLYNFDSGYSNVVMHYNAPVVYTVMHKKTYETIQENQENSVADWSRTSKRNSDDSRILTITTI